MVEAKYFKLKEYFTNVINHDDNNKPGQIQHFMTSKKYQNMHRIPSEKPVKSCSPIRYNDTHRSKVLEGDFVQRSDFKRITSVKQFSPGRSQSNYNTERGTERIDMGFVDQ
jgi:hypothetical protein